MRAISCGSLRRYGMESSANLSAADRDPARTNGTPHDRRRLIPATGLREYWYPGIQAKKVGRGKVVQVRMLDRELVFFQGRDGKVAALWSVCPHRGGNLGDGDVHFDGTVTCPYHAWTFDGAGECVAVLTEGPDSLIPGKVRARHYPTRTLKGVVFVWMGESEPAPIEEDVPEEFFEPDSESMVFVFAQEWPVNWAVALENSLDSHVPYVHRNSWNAAVGGMTHYGPRGRRPVLVKNGVGATPTESVPRPAQEYYPGLGKWPRSQWRRLWTWAFRLAVRRSRKRTPFQRAPEWGMAHHLPAMFRTTASTHAYTRVCVPMDAGHSRVTYYYSTRPANFLHRAYIWAQYYLWFKWHMLVHFSNQDLHPMKNQRWDTPEMLSPNDAELIVWRKILTQARGLQPASGSNGESQGGENFAHGMERTLGMDSSETVEGLERRA
jgi:phenylpropionate dioxygenase-like ring-hydroxylating dioxygenase large terminal subunit